jgi:hypothetical protein
MDPIKEAFAKAKQDILSLQGQIESLKQDIQSLKDTMKESSLNTSNQQTDRQTNTSNSPTQTPSDHPMYQSNQQETSAYQHIPTDRLPLKALKTSFNNVSIGNDGVPTDRQTNQQTDRHIGNKGVFLPSKGQELPMKLPKLREEDEISHLEQVSNILSSLDSLKKELRIKFKRLSKQEMQVFSIIYDLENQGFIVDYSLLAEKLSLSESSIRDYIQKIIKKGIPIIKTKENNKKILLSIDKNLKELANLQTILALREL